MPQHNKELAKKQDPAKTMAIFMPEMLINWSGMNSDEH